MTQILYRIFLCIAAFGVLGMSHNAKPSASAWHTWKDHFLDSSGRVIDTGNGGISHSEGQGYGMVLAVYHNDPQAFDRIYGWANQILRIRSDRFYAWKYDPRKTGADAIPDLNNATDGDLLISWALLMAGQKWQRSDYLKEGLFLAEGIKRDLVRSISNRVILLPWKDGQKGPEFGYDFNLAYWVYPALSEISKLDPDPIWQQLIASGLELTAAAQFSAYRLPSNWVHLSPEGVLKPANGWEAEFGYDVIRVPLYLIWGKFGHPQMIENYYHFAVQFGSTKNIPARVNLINSEMPSEKANIGLQSVWQLVLDCYEGQKGRRDNLILGEDDYYSATLRMMVDLARHGQGYAQ